MPKPFITITVDPDADDGVSVDYDKGFYKKPLIEQANLLTSALNAVHDEFVGVHEELIDMLQSAVADARMGVAA